MEGKLGWQRLTRVSRAGWTVIGQVGYSNGLKQSISQNIKSTVSWKGPTSVIKVQLLYFCF